MYLDEALFELDMRHIFEGDWVYVAHECQLPNKNDYLTTYIGRQPVIVTRNEAGEIRCLMNTCAHRGARVCRKKRGNSRVLMCGFHNWCYNTNGDLVDVLNEDTGAYPPKFSREDHGLTPAAHVDIYRGFIFATLNPDSAPLREYLNGAMDFIDLLVDQSPTGETEYLRGVTSYFYRGNWKLQAESGVDGYHVAGVHGNYLMTAARRTQGLSDNDTRVLDLAKFAGGAGGFMAFEQGHVMIWGPYPNNEDRPNFEVRDQYLQKYGPERTTWMNERMRNLLVFPNVFVMDQASSQIRIVRPVTVDLTEVTTYCIAPVGESEAARAKRIRQYEDFFNASGMATPDDLTEFMHCQEGYKARHSRWNDLSRGAERWIEGVSDEEKRQGFDARLSSHIDIGDEGIYVAMYEAWRERVKQAITKELGAK
ncbi:aromatic ring-hydroxylating oxygenase subunit alpha [Stutzerimonas nitrititolerans]|uniref:aromatic ring-hydroxylating oxygenase subunit alpha n=1 Tax=Stutzerimonas nitrititolerans TaxID=2482751 RepID=UPI0028AF42D3|nr:aromatic ring-hydroxylating dioxygenase subunit alpha [Stutzerimonas nitrititolerans]